MQDHVGAAAGDGVPEPDERAHGDADPPLRPLPRRGPGSPSGSLVRASRRTGSRSRAGARCG